MNLIRGVQSAIYQKYGSHPLVRALYQNRLVRKIIHFFFKDLLSGVYQLEITSICNARCVFCSYPKIAEDKASLVNISDKVFANFLEFARKSKKRKIHIGPLVGENFVNKDWAKYLEVVLTEDYVTNVKFITNGILMTKENVDKLVQMRHLDKLSVDISIGGSDAAVYQKMYGVDRFKNVKANVQYLLEELRKIGSRAAVTLEFRVPDLAAFDIKRTGQEFNPTGYAHAATSAIDTYDPLNGTSEAETANLKVLPPVAHKVKPCKLLGNILFRSGGDIALCGCITSTGNMLEGLMVGKAGSSSYDEVVARQKEIIARWKNDRVLPKSCRDCSLYTAV